MAEVGRTLARIEENQAEASKQIAVLAQTVHIAFHGPTDQPPDRPTGFIPRLLEVERVQREAARTSTGWRERLQAGAIAGAVSLLLHFVHNWDSYTDAIKKGGHP